MKTVKARLYNALAALGHVSHELNCALQLATDTSYGPHWINVIDKALKHNHEATIHLQNVAQSIRHPAEPPYSLKPSIVRPKVL